MAMCRVKARNGSVLFDASKVVWVMPFYDKYEGEMVPHSQVCLADGSILAISQDSASVIASIERTE